MKIRTLESRALSFCLIVALLATYSMSALAGERRMAGEILVTGSGTSAVLVNGEEIKSGRTLFSSSSISTSDGASAVVNLGSLGSLRVAPDTEFLLTFSEYGINCELIKGKLTVINSAVGVRVNLPDGKTAKISAGESVAAAQDDDDDDDAGSGAWVLWAVVFGGAAAAMIWATTRDNNRVDVGGGTTIVSPSV